MEFEEFTFDYGIRDSRLYRLLYSRSLSYNLCIQRDVQAVLCESSRTAGGARYLFC
jgi:hypothetical protein